MTTNVERMLPLYQGMMAAMLNHRAADVVRSPTAAKRQNQPSYLESSDLEDPFRSAQPAYWVRADLLPPLPSWLLAFSNVTSPTNERSMVTYGLPRAAVGHSTPLVQTPQQVLLVALLSSFALDYVLRQKLGGVNLTYNYVQQLACPAPAMFDRAMPGKESFKDWVRPRVSELLYTAHDMAGFAAALDLESRPFVWDAARREILRAELDAAFFHLYGIIRDDVDYIMETFPIVKRKDIAAHGEYRTKRLILGIFDAMQNAIETGTAYETILDPPPGQGARHPAKDS